MNHAKKQLQALIKRCQNEGINPLALKSVQKQMASESRKTSKLKKWLTYITLTIALCYSVDYYRQELLREDCVLGMPSSLKYAFRPPEQCHFCSNVTQVPRLSGISTEEFQLNYAYTGVPVVITDATKNWSAIDTFDYWYFRDIYRKARRRRRILDCQFLPYKTGFVNLFEALDMPRERVEQQSGTQPWYFGWSNCSPETAEILRRHYGKPYFLPPDSENGAVDWFFMGTSGLGAHMHVDNVRLPSWQAQLRGSKRWILTPPPECYFECQSTIEVVVEKGDIIVLDTNKWYHQTFVQPGELSLTIGAEYD